MSSDLEFVTTEDLIAELASRSKNIMVFYALESEPQACRHYREGNTPWMIGVLAAYQQDIINKFNAGEQEPYEPDDPA